MNVSEIFIRRPVAALLLMAAIVMFGVLGYGMLPVSELPPVDYPTIGVSAYLPGASPETMAATVATPLEAQISTIPGVDSMNSQSTEGITAITVQFRLDRNIDAAAQDTESAIAAAARKLPPQLPAQPIARKFNSADVPPVTLAMSSALVPPSKLDDYAETLLARQLSTLDGVAQVNIYGSQKLAVRVEADPHALAARQIGIDQLATAIDSLNANVPTGTLNGMQRAEVVRVQGGLGDAADFERQVIAWRDGAPVYLRDVARVVDSVENDKGAAWMNGERAIVLAVQRQPGANTIAIVDEMKRVLPEFVKQLPPSIKVQTLYDNSQSIRRSIRDVQWSLMIAVALVVGVVFAFLGALPATIIVALALPVSLIGTFAAMACLGYSLDNFSLLALALSVGFVVDDAIVMLENIYRHIEQGESAFRAALAGSREIWFTVMSMTVSLAVVFIPILFMGGIVGKLLHEFAVTIVAAIALSGVVSIVLTPALCALLLRKRASAMSGRFQRLCTKTFEAGLAAYASTLRWSLVHREIVLSLFVASVVGSAMMFGAVPKDFLPATDTDLIQIGTEAANGTSFQQMVRYQQQVVHIIRADPAVEAVMSSVGARGPLNGTNIGTIFVHLKPRSRRDASAFEIRDRLRAKLASLIGINAFMRIPPSLSIGGLNTKSVYQYSLESLDLDVLRDSTSALTRAMAASPEFRDVTNDLDLSTPTAAIDIDRERASVLGITPKQVEDALDAAFGGEQISTIYGAADQYRVVLEVQPKFRTEPANLSDLYLTSSNGSLVPLTALTTTRDSVSALAINHIGQLPAATISFDLPPGRALSDAVSEVDRLRRDVALPLSVQGSFQGTVQAFQASIANLNLLLLIATLVAYVVLGILYESFIHPLTILSGLPSAALGALIALWAFGEPLSLYGFVGAIMLVGIVKKNAIMMIDFALARQREAGLSAADAIVEAALIRFRPIMMTTAAALLAALPIAIGFGAGSEARRPLGLAVAGGLLVSQVLTLYITPTMFLYLERFSRYLSIRIMPLFNRVPA